MTYEGNDAATSEHIGAKVSIVCEGTKKPADHAEGQLLGKGANWCSRPRPVIHYQLPTKMSRVTISTAPCDASTSLVSAVGRITNLGVLEVRDRLSAGEPVFDQELFGNRTEDVFAKARALLSALERGGHQPLVREAGRPITPQTLRNIFQASEEEAQELRRLDDLGHA